MSRSARLLLLAPCAIASCVIVAGCNAATESANVGVAELISDDTRATAHFAYGEPASAAEIKGWDIDVRPDGLGLPPGSATAEDGEMLYEDQCASCHGSFGEGVGRYPVLAGGEDTLTEARPEKTVGSFWPYASTLWDYIHRAMPFAEPESLSDDEVYAITAYVLYLNDLVDYDFELTQANLADIEMPNRDGFFLDDRPDVVAERCMKNCKDPATIKITSEPEIAEAGETDESAATEAGHSDQALSGQAIVGRTTYERACAVCHASGVGEAPIPGDRVAWSARVAAGRDTLIASAINGKGIMPPRGGQSQLSDAEITAAVDYILSVGNDHD